MKRKYKIVVKRDFPDPGFWIAGRWVRTGFVVTDGFCNVMPGATWFRTIEDAFRAIEALERVKVTGGNFWQMYRDLTTARVLAGYA